MHVYRTWKNTPEEAISIIIKTIFFTSDSINFSVLDHNILWIDCFPLPFERSPLSKNIYWEYTRGKYHTGIGSFRIILNSLSRHCPSMYQSEVMDLEHHVVITYWTTPPNLHTQRTFTLLQTNQRKSCQVVKWNLCYCCYTPRIFFSYIHQSYCFNKTWQVRVSSRMAWLSLISPRFSVTPTYADEPCGKAQHTTPKQKR